MRVVSLVATGLALLSSSLRAQEVRGTVTDRASGAPQPGVVVQLLDSSGLVVARTLTDPAGGYRLAAHAAGPHVVRVLRIGFRPAEQAVLLRAAQVAEVSLHAGAAISLAEVRVSSRRTCEMHPDSGSITFAVWEQVRTALTAALITSTRNLVTSAVVYERVLDERGARIVRQATSLRAGVAGIPWRSISADSLSRVGYVVTEPGGATTYFAPDLHVLTSVQFAAEHCLRLVGDAARLGIAFEPSRDRRGVPEIAGTLWLERSTAELQSLTYRYVNLPRQQQAVAGGELDFARLPSGEWLIVRWHVRVPVIETRYAAGGVLRGGGQVAGRVILEVREEGGALALARAGRDTVWKRASIVVAGQVRVESGPALPNATVTLRGTGLSTTSDDQGRFMLDAVIPGVYTVDVETPSLAATGERRSETVTLTESRTDLQLRVPPDWDVAVRTCGPTTGLLLGRVLKSDGTPASGAVAVVDWSEFTLGEREVVQRRREVDAPTDVHGYFRACGVRSRHPLVVRAEGATGVAGPDTARIPRDSGVTFITLRLGTHPTDAFTLIGRVIGDVDGKPIPDAVVSIAALGRATLTTAEGAYRLRDLPGGTHQVRVRRLGMRPDSAQVVLGGVPATKRDWVLSRVAVLDTVAVVADPRLIEFERNREMGFGSFLTRADIAKYDLQDFPEVIAHLPGIYVRRIGSAGYVTGTRSRGTFSCGTLRFESTAPERPSACACYVQVYVDNVLLYGGGEGEVIPNINNILTTDVEAVEFYAGAAQMPARYNRPNAHCGALVVHTRRYGTPTAPPNRPPS